MNFVAYVDGHKEELTYITAPDVAKATDAFRAILRAEFKAHNVVCEEVSAIPENEYYISWACWQNEVAMEQSARPQTNHLHNVVVERDTPPSIAWCVTGTTKHGARYHVWFWMAKHDPSGAKRKQFGQDSPLYRNGREQRADTARNAEIIAELTVAMRAEWLKNGGK